MRKPPRTFFFVRNDDVHGMTGEGVVAEGTLWFNGKVTMCWYPGKAGVSSLVDFDCLQDLIKSHGHEGKSFPVFHDTEAGQRLLELSSTEGNASCPMCCARLDTFISTKL